MKTVNLYLDMEFTSLSPDAQPISIGIVSDERDVRDYPIMTRPEKPGNKIEFIDQSLKFYAEFTDFDIRRCDDWVKENVVGKLLFNEHGLFRHNYGNLKRIKDDTKTIKESLFNWLEKFSNHNIQIVVDCGTWDWYHFLQLVAEWEETPEVLSVNIDSIPPNMTLDDVIEMFEKSPVVFHQNIPSIPVKSGLKKGLPKLPSNISPVPLDLNDLIAFKKRITTKEAFDLNREELLISDVSGMQVTDASTLNGEPIQKHNALFDAKVIKEVFNYINQQ